MPGLRLLVPANWPAKILRPEMPLAELGEVSSANQPEPIGTMNENGHQLERDGESLLTQCCQDLGVSEPVAIGIIEWSEERFGVPIKQSNGGSALQSSVTIEQMARCLLKFKQPYMPMRVLFWALDSRVLDDALGHPSLTDIAEQCGCTKQNCGKCLSVIQRELNLPPRKTQRSAESKKKMSEKRKAQFK